MSTIVPLWLLFMSTAVAVLARNGEEFYPSPALFELNAVALGVCLAAVVLLSLFIPRSESLVRGSFGLTIGVLIYTLGGARSQGDPRRLYWLIAAGTAVSCLIWVARHLASASLRQFLVLTFALTAAWDIWSFRLLAKAVTGPKGGTPAATPAHLPNIYHFVFDGYQADVFADLMEGDGDTGTLDGFTWFRNSAASAPNTIDALAELFAPVDADRFLWLQTGWPGRRDEFYREAHAGNDSLKHRLKKAGYHTVGHVFYPTQYAHFAEGFDEFVPHATYVESQTVQVDDSRLFFNLWLLSVLPRQISSRLLSNVTIERLAGEGTLSRYPSLISYAAVQKFLGEEFAQPESGRYVFFHVLLPHKPFIFDQACHIQATDWGDEPDDGAVRGQYRCARALMNDIVAGLKRLNRFDSSMIILHSDHGDGMRKDGAGRYFRKIDPQVPDTFTRALLLVKWPGEGDAKRLQTSDFPARVADVTRTILARVDPASAVRIKGVDLMTDADDTAPRVRYFYWERESETLRYHIDAGGRVVARDTLQIKDSHERDAPR